MSNFGLYCLAHDFFIFRS